MGKVISAWLTDRVRVCANCKSRPRDRSTTVSPDIAPFATVDPSRYCSTECADEANSRMAW